MSQRAPEGTFRLNFCMLRRDGAGQDRTVWDRAAARRLEEITAELAETGVLALFERLVAETWRYNCQRYEPAEAGDTPRSLGVTASENLRVRVLREINDLTSGWAERGVLATSPDNALRVHARGVDVRQMKAPGSEVRLPRWEEFNWTSESESRFSSAEANTRAYGIPPAPAGQEVIPGLLPPGDPSVLRHVLLVWSGEIETGYTAGWLGLPVIGEHPWLAVQELWWHEGGLARPVRGVRGTTSSPETFAERPQPVPLIFLKPRSEGAGQP